MTNKQKSIAILKTIMSEFGMPESSTLGDVALLLGMVDPSGEVMKLLTKTMTAAVVDEIKAQI